MRRIETVEVANYLGGKVRVHFDESKMTGEERRTLLFMLEILDTYDTGEEAEA